MEQIGPKFSLVHVIRTQNTKFQNITLSYCYPWGILHAAILVLAVHKSRASTSPNLQTLSREGSSEHQRRNRFIQVSNKSVIRRAKESCLPTFRTRLYPPNNTCQNTVDVTLDVSPKRNDINTTNRVTLRPCSSQARSTEN